MEATDVWKAEASHRGISSEMAVLLTAVTVDVINLPWRQTRGERRGPPARELWRVFVGSIPQKTRHKEECKEKRKWRKVD